MPWAPCALRELRIATITGASGLSGETPYEFLSHDIQVRALYEWLAAHRQWRVARPGYERRFPPSRRCSQNIPRMTGDKP